MQLGPCRIALVSRRVLRIHGGSDRPEIVAAIEAAGGEIDGAGKCWWLPASKLRLLSRLLKPVSDPLFPSGLCPGPRPDG